MSSIALAVHVLFLSELSNQKTTSDRQECRIFWLQQFSLHVTTLISALTSSQQAISDPGSRRRNWKIQKHEFIQGAVQMNKVHLSAGEAQIQTGLGHKQTEVWWPLANICQSHKTITLVCTELSPQKKNQNGINYCKRGLRYSSPTDRQKVDTICFALAFRQYHANLILQAWY